MIQSRGFLKAKNPILEVICVYYPADEVDPVYPVFLFLLCFQKV
jgi:hypothetical protein